MNSSGIGVASRVHPTAVVHPSAILHRDVVIGPYSIIEEDVVIGEGTVIEAHALIGAHTRMGSRNHVHHGAIIGSIPQDLKFHGALSYTSIGDDNVFREYCTINRGTDENEITRIGNGGLFMAYSHVAHNCEVGDHVVMANSATLAGHVVIGDWAVIGGLSGVHQFTRIGAHAMVGGCSPVRQDIPTYLLAAGAEPRLVGVNVVGLTRRGFTEVEIQAIRAAYRTIFRSQRSVATALDCLEAQEPHPVVLPLIEFLKRSTRGVIRPGRSTPRTPTV